MVFNGSGKGYLPAGTICNRTHILSEWLKAGAEFKQPKKGHRPASMPLKRTHFLSYNPKSSIPIVAMTANAFEDDIKECLDAGMNAHVAKPIDVHALKEELSLLS